MASNTSDAGFGGLPRTASRTHIKPFTLDFPESDVKAMLDLLRLTPIASANYENSLPDGDRRLGVRREWLVNAKKTWESGEFDWKKREAFINSFPQFKASVADTLGDFEIHFAALFSRREDAVTVLFLHGWPGSFMEFLPILDILRTRYTPDTLPYHVVVPSLPGFTLSSPQPVDKDMAGPDAARVLDSLTQLLGFEKYVAQGGDVGSRVARIMGALHERCKAVHLNACFMAEPKSLKGEITELEQNGLKRADNWKTTGMAYALEHATKPSTIGFVLSSNPLALLAWVGEKFMDWTDADPPLDTILESVSLYWLSKSAHTSLWSYRASFGPKGKDHSSPEWHINKPFGYSYFPKELIPVPVAWVATTGDLVFTRVHDSGGHFAAAEKPAELLKDVEEFVAQIRSEL